MKKTFAFITAAMILATAFYSCSKGGTTKTTPSGSSHKMTYSLNGTSVTTDSCTYLFPRIGDTTYVEIFGWKGGISQVTIHLLRYHGAASYVLSTDGYAELKASVGSSTDPSNGGSVVITSTSSNLAGTFSFTTSSGALVTNGSFVSAKH